MANINIEAFVKETRELAEQIANSKADPYYLGMSVGVKKMLDIFEKNLKEK